MSVKVAVRVRPFNKREQEMNSQLIVEMSGNTTKIKAPPGVNTNYKSEFTFDNSFWSFDQFKTEENGYMSPTGDKYSDQQKVFETLGKPILDNAWEGYHCCLFAYGQTGSGKSYSMIGYGVNKGIVPIACEEIFKRLDGKKAGEDYDVTVSMIEIYNQKVNDLLVDPKKRIPEGLPIRENKLLGVYVEGATKTFVSGYASIESLMDEGSKNRTIAATQMNATSSRAHTIISITFAQHQVVANKKTSKISVINLVDLAGSQRQGKTGATGDRLKEGAGINLSLSTLGQVISALADKADSKKDVFVPYRNSALTRILQNALGGNSKTCVICAISPAADNFEETLSTLRYADQAKKIKNTPVVNETETDKIIKGLKDENERLKALLAEKEKMLMGIGGGQRREQREQMTQVQRHQEQPQPIQQRQEQPEPTQPESKHVQNVDLIEQDRLEKQRLQRADAQLKRKSKEQEEILEMNRQEQERAKLQQQKKEEEQHQLQKQPSQQKRQEQRDQPQQSQQPQQHMQQPQQHKEQPHKILQQQQQPQPQHQPQKQQQQQPIQNNPQVPVPAQDDKNYKQMSKNLVSGIQNIFSHGNPLAEVAGTSNQVKDQKKMTIQEIETQQKYLEELIRQFNMNAHDKIQEEQRNFNNINQVTGQFLNMNLQQQPPPGAYLMGRSGFRNLMEQKELLRQQNVQRQSVIPSFLENISRDIMTNRKIKIFLAKQSIIVGKYGTYPPCDIIIAGRDVEPVHAEFTVQEGRVFLIPYNFKCLVYRNGKPVKSKIELKHLDRIVFGWNSLYLFKVMDDRNYNERIRDRMIDWDFYREEMKDEQDIDQSDTEDGANCCLLM